MTQKTWFDSRNVPKSFFLPNRPDLLRGPLIFLWNDYRGSFPQSKTSGSVTDSSYPNSAKVKNAWNCTSILYIILSQRLLVRIYSNSWNAWTLKSEPIAFHETSLKIPPPPKKAKISLTPRWESEAMRRIIFFFFYFEVLSLHLFYLTGIDAAWLHVCSVLNCDNVHADDVVSVKTYSVSLGKV